MVWRELSSGSKSTTLERDESVLFFQIPFYVCLKFRFFCFHLLELLRPQVVFAHVYMLPIHIMLTESARAVPRIRDPSGMHKRSTLSQKQNFWVTYVMFHV